MTVTGSRPADYKALRQKLLFLIALITGGALLALAILAVLADNRLGNYIVRVLQMLGLEYDRAYRVFRLISASQDILMLVVLAIFILVFSSFLLRRFVRYFIEISDSLDILVEDRAGEIKLSAEMAAMEAKLNSIKQTLERREREAKEAEQRKNDVVMYIAHDIKTPLTSVIGYLSLLDEVPDMPIEQKARYVSISLEKAYQLEQLIEEFFEITRYNLQGIELDKQRIDLYYMLVQLVDEHYPQLSQQGMQAKVTAP
ncbi:MAG: vancomycin resistance histidine kinase VanS, partial [Coriobacteriia bacterium]|nr:vancomycin resistance histidine kinase VanS [Coriobacteriia bacterium]